MTRVLATDEIEQVLQAQAVGRIGCHANGRTYVVPICYAYDHGAIYAHAADGQKIRMMRQNPAVCFEVDHVEDLVNWSTAISWGTYEELRGEAAEHGLALLRERLARELPRMLEHRKLAAEQPLAGEPPIVFRINITETSGREERLYWGLLPLAPEPPHARPASRTAPLTPAADIIPEDVLAERDAEDRGMVSLPAEAGTWT
jgi:nitroimidazol reductase NimA-like FMN-containing flavoprotein (pyridoxamine 5'-phosphate oxidase superfamily)